ncbi:MAG: sigma-70 family RNA polymerase sigma factor [Planctomycetia bacterium]|nr:sigma-70 family RNA polymerase sigma factor [Planctomycetia bacterium]
MHDLPDTRLSLLARLQDRGDRLAWDEFVRVYEPAMYRLARQRGLQDADARDLTQDVLGAVSGAIHRWTPGETPGGFRAWLYTIARNLTVNALTRGGRHRGAGDTAVFDILQATPDDRAEATQFSIEYRRQAFAQAAEAVRDEVRTSTWQAFWMTAVEGMEIAAVAAKLNVSVGVVYAARSRVLARLREKVEQLEGN